MGLTKRSIRDCFKVYLNKIISVLIDICYLDFDQGQDSLNYYDKLFYAENFIVETNIILKQIIEASSKTHLSENNFGKYSSKLSSLFKLTNLYVDNYALQCVQSIIQVLILFIYFTNDFERSKIMIEDGDYLQILIFIFNMDFKIKKKTIWYYS